LGLGLSLGGIVLLFCAGDGLKLSQNWAIILVYLMAICSLGGVLVSVAGLFQRPRRLAGWGLVVGIIGTLYLPTMFLSLLR
jgi:hypothetical protein